MARTVMTSHLYLYMAAIPEFFIICPPPFFCFFLRAKKKKKKVFFPLDILAELPSSTRAFNDYTHTAFTHKNMK